MTAKGSDQQGTNHAEATFLVTGAVILMIGTLIWILARPYIVMPIFAIEWAEIKLVQYTVGLGDTGREVKEFVEGTLRGHRDPWLIDIFDFADIKTLVGERVKLPLSLLTAALAGVLAMRMRGDGYKRVFSLDSLMKEQAKEWRTTMFSANFSPDTDWSEMEPQKSPPEWLRDNKIAVVKGKIDREKAERCLIDELGAPWSGIDNLPLHAQAILAICAVHMDRKKNAPRHLREDLTMAYALEKDVKKRDADVMALIAPILKDKRHTDKINKVASKHAWTSTVLFEFIDVARREAGVLPSAEFLWLKAQDRTLWYVMNNAGRRAFHLEGGGAVGHYFYEKVSGKPMTQPKLEKVLDGIEDYLSDHGIEDLTRIMPVD